MIEQHASPAMILPVSPDTPRPVWSVMIPTYNCARYLRETLASVLAQDPGPDVMQIEVVDDCSTQDDPKSIVEELGQGRVQFYQQPQNVGSTANFNTCLARSRGHLVHLLHGDDRVREGFYQTMQAAFDQNPNVGAAFCRHVLIDEFDHWQYVSNLQATKRGVIDGWLSKIAVQNRLQPPAIVVRRDVYEAIGGFDPRIVCCGEDWEMWIRIAAHYSVWYEPHPLALYRVHSTNLTGRCARSGQNLRDMKRIIEIAQFYIPTEIAKHSVPQAKEECAIYAALCILPPMLKDHDLKAATTQLKEIFRLSRSTAVLQALVKMNLKLWKANVKETLKLMLNLSPSTVNGKT